MNRKERRAFVQKAKQKGIRKDVAEMYLALKDAGIDSPPIDAKKFENGDKVTLNVEQITGRKGYDKLSKPYREFVEAHQGTVFTVKVERDSLVSFEEYPQWLFWAGDLNEAQELAPEEEQPEE